MMIAGSIWWRKRKARKNAPKVLHTFHSWLTWIQQAFPNAGQHQDCILLVKLDDIGDYILFRNLLEYYRKYAGGRRLILIGNEAWKTIFQHFDAGIVDEVVWVNKNKYFDEEAYRHGIWNVVRAFNAETILVPALTRSLLLDDMMTIASGASTRIAGFNTHEHGMWNEHSNALYTTLFDIDKQQFEFNTNVLFLEQLLNENIPIERTHLPHIPTNGEIEKPYVAIFIGANIKSRRWHASGWIKLINQLSSLYPNYSWVLLGGPADGALAKKIMDNIGHHVKLIDKVGKQDLLSSMAIIQAAAALITNNTMSYHVSMASNVPTIIITSGDKYYRFTEIDNRLYQNTQVIYPPRFEKLRSAGNISAMQTFHAVKQDIVSIKASTVLDVILKSKILKV